MPKMTTGEHLRRAYNHIQAAIKGEQGTITGRLLVTKLQNVTRFLKEAMEWIP